MIATKIDLESDRQVPVDEGRALADEFGMQFFETSSATGHNVSEAFYEIAKNIKDKSIASTKVNNGG